MNPDAFTAIVVDDELLAVEGVRRMCATSALVTVIGEAYDGPSALDLIERSAPQAIFLDIAMPGMTGLDVAAALQALPCAPRVVFVTANDNFATQAFDLSVVDYLLKPIEQGRFDRAIERLGAAIESHAPRGEPNDALWVPYRGTVIRLSVSDILRMDAERDYVRINDAERSYLLRATLSDLSERLGDRFLRIHRSTAIARHRVQGLRHVGSGSWLVVDLDGGEFPIGRTYLAEVRASLLR